MKTNKLLLRVLIFTSGLFVMALGVALSVKANLGVSPISCIPYVYSLIVPLTLGQLTIAFNILLIIMQIILLRRDYQLIQLIQIPVVFVFGLFIDLTLYLVSDLHVTAYVWQMTWCLISCVMVAFGVFLEVKASITYLPGEGLALAITKVFKNEFGKAKIEVDSTMVVIGLISTLVFLSQLQGIREGTVLAAILVGFFVKIFNKNISLIDNWFGEEIEDDVTTELVLESSNEV